jgi:hypothetical protein
MWRCHPAAYSAKAVPPFSSSNNQLHSCRLLNAEKCGANNQQEQSKAPLTVWYEIHTINLPIQQWNWRSTSKLWSMGACEGAFPPPILQKQHWLPFSSSNNRLHSCKLLIAEKCGANNWKEQSKAPLTVWYEIHTSAQPIQQPNQRSKSKKWSMGVCEGTFLPPILQKQHRPSALQKINCTPADYWLQKSVGQTSNVSRARLHSLFGMKFTQVPSQYSNQIREVQARNKVWVCVKAPSHCLSCKSSTTLQLFKQSTALLQTNALQLFKQLTALLQTIDCRKAWDKQPTGTEQGSPHCSVWNSHKCAANTATDLQNKPFHPTIQLSFTW